MSAPVVGVLALQGDVREHVRALTAAGATPVAVRRPAELAGLDGIVLPGGESTTMGKLMVAFDVLEPLRARVADGLPAYGSCAGMILLADAILDGLPEQPRIGGIDMVVRRNAFGRQVDSFEAPLELPAIGAEPIHAVFIRAPWVEKVGAAVDVLGRMPAEGLHRLGRRAAGAGGEGGPAEPSDPAEVIGRIVAVRQGNLLATAFHPELTGDARVHRLFVDIVRERS